MVVAALWKAAYRRVYNQVTCGLIDYETAISDALQARIDYGTTLKY